MSSKGRPWWGGVRAASRVQIRAPAIPSTASLSASTASTGWMKKPHEDPSPAGPRPLRRAPRPAKLISVVSCAATIRRPRAASLVRETDEASSVETSISGRISTYPRCADSPSQLSECRAHLSSQVHASLQRGPACRFPGNPRGAPRRPRCVRQRRSRHAGYRPRYRRRCVPVCQRRWRPLDLHGLPCSDLLRAAARRFSKCFLT